MSSPRRYFLLLLLALPLSACTTPKHIPVSSDGKVAIFDPKPVKVEEGMASWYKDRRTASGEPFKSQAMTAAHKKLPFGSSVRVVDLKTKKSIIVRINDRGPYVRGRVIDLTTGAARQLGIYDRGLARVRLEVLREIPIMEKPNLHYKKPSAYASTARRQPQSESPVIASRQDFNYARSTP